jgi:hypothetical protein
VLDFKQENTTFGLKIPKFQFFKRTKLVGAIIWKSKTVSASAMSHKTANYGVFLILPDVPANRWNLGILE